MSIPPIPPYQAQNSYHVTQPMFGSRPEKRSRTSREQSSDSFLPDSSASEDEWSPSSRPSTRKKRKVDQPGSKPISGKSRSPFVIPSGTSAGESSVKQEDHELFAPLRTSILEEMDPQTYRVLPARIVCTIGDDGIPQFSTSPKPGSIYHVRNLPQKPARNHHERFPLQDPSCQEHVIKPLADKTDPRYCAKGVELLSLEMFQSSQWDFHQTLRGHSSQKIADIIHQNEINVGRELKAIIEKKTKPNYLYKTNRIPPGSVPAYESELVGENGLFATQDITGDGLYNLDFYKGAFIFDPQDMTQQINQHGKRFLPYLREVKWTDQNGKKQKAHIGGYCSGAEMHNSNTMLRVQWDGSMDSHPTGANVMFVDYIATFLDRDGNRLTLPVVAIAPIPGTFIPKGTEFRLDYGSKFAEVLANGRFQKTQVKEEPQSDPEILENSTENPFQKAFFDDGDSTLTEPSENEAPQGSAGRRVLAHHGKSISPEYSMDKLSSSDEETAPNSSTPNSKIIVKTPVGGPRKYTAEDYKEAARIFKIDYRNKAPNSKIKHDVNDKKVSGSAFTHWYRRWLELGRPTPDVFADDMTKKAQTYTVEDYKLAAAIFATQHLEVEPKQNQLYRVGNKEIPGNTFKKWFELWNINNRPKPETFAEIMAKKNQTYNAEDYREVAGLFHKEYSQSKPKQTGSYSINQKKISGQTILNWYQKWLNAEKPEADEFSELMTQSNQTYNAEDYKAAARLLLERFSEEKPKTRETYQLGETEISGHTLNNWREKWLGADKPNPETFAALMLQSKDYEAKDYKAAAKLFLEKFLEEKPKTKKAYQLGETEISGQTLYNWHKKWLNAGKPVPEEFAALMLVRKKTIYTAKDYLAAARLFKEKYSTIKPEQKTTHPLGEIEVPGDTLYNWHKKWLSAGKSNPEAFSELMTQSNQTYNAEDYKAAARLLLERFSEEKPKTRETYWLGETEISGHTLNNWREKWLGADKPNPETFAALMSTKKKTQYTPDDYKAAAEQFTTVFATKKPNSREPYYYIGQKEIPGRVLWEWYNKWEAKGRPTPDDFANKKRKKSRVKK